jgi:ribosomal protein L11 methyltransferase
MAEQRADSPRWAEVALRVSAEMVEPATAVLDAAGFAGVAVHDPQAISSDPFADWAQADAPEDGDLRTRVTGYFPVDDRLEAAIDDLQQRLRVLIDEGLPVSDELTLRTVLESDWADAWKTYFKPIRVGDHLVVKPTWEAWDTAPGEVVLDIDPGMAFGSGGHATTRLCLALLETVIRSGNRVLDWGTGSGILAVGAAALGARQVDACDLDPVAVRVAGENIERNRMGDRITVQVDSIEAMPVEPPYDVVVANIVADPIIEGVGEIALRLRAGGLALVSGIIDTREAEVAAALTAAGLTAVETREEEDWRALLFRKP